jgi:hypothetical protein
LRRLDPLRTAFGENLKEINYSTPEENRRSESTLVRENSRIFLVFFFFIRIFAKVTKIVGM